MKDFVLYKKNYLNSLSKIPTFSKVWGAWSKNIENELQPCNGENLFNIGDKMREIFFATNEGRGQKDVSGGGNVWECFVTWYLNLVFWNTPLMAMKMSKKFVPEVLFNCIAVTIANNTSNTESDILVFNVPHYEEFKGNNVNDLNNFITQNIQKIKLWVIQCKTNWADNAQVPMLWDLVYSSSINRSNVTVGNNGLSPSSLGDFRYAFVTCPTQKNLSKFKHNSVNVLRVKHLTGGNFWGTNTKSDIARSIKELPPTIYKNFLGGVPSHIEKNIRTDSSFPKNFLELSW